MNQIATPKLCQLVSRVADEIAQRVVHLPAATIHTDHSHADRSGGKAVIGVE
jgi:RecJ-like exonuclease